MNIALSVQCAASPIARAHAALVHQDLSTALRLAAAGDVNERPTVPWTPSPRQVRRWRRLATGRLADLAARIVADATTTVASAVRACATVHCPPPAMALPSDDCCTGKWFHTNECPYWREAGT